MSSLSALIQIVQEIIAIAIRQQKKIKAIWNEKEEMKLTLVADDTVVSKKIS